MNNINIAKSYIRQAKERLKHAGEAIENGNYPYTIRQSQEAVELALKAALRIVGIEPPKWHDVGPILKREFNRFPKWFQEKIAFMARVSRRLRREREPAMYGDEELGLAPEDLYDKVDAEEALRDAQHVVDLVEKLFIEAINKS